MQYGNIDNTASALPTPPTTTRPRPEPTGTAGAAGARPARPAAAPAYPLRALVETAKACATRRHGRCMGGRQGGCNGRGQAGEERSTASVAPTSQSKPPPPTSPQSTAANAGVGAGEPPAAGTLPAAVGGLQPPCAAAATGASSPRAALPLLLPRWSVAAVTARGPASCTHKRQASSEHWTATN